MRTNDFHYKQEPKITDTRITALLNETDCFVHTVVSSMDESNGLIQKINRSHVTIATHPIVHLIPVCKWKRQR